MKKKFKLAVPAGIGDYSWMHSKLCTIPDAEFEIFVPDCYPQRTKPYIDLLPNCTGKVGRHDYNDLLNWGRVRGGKTWEQILKNNNDGNDFIYLQCNEHLGAGIPLADWLPDLKTDFHYKLDVDFENKYPWPKEYKDSKKIGITMASMRGIRAWNAWLPETWAEFVRKVNRDHPDVVFVLLGGQWDIDTAVELMGILDGKVKCIDLVGMTNIKEAIKIIDEVDYFIGYSSGLTVLRTVVNKPCTTLWPRHQMMLINSWAPPEMINSRDYMGFVYDSADRIHKRVKVKIKEALNGSRRVK